ncbi:hypothetical protein [Blastococcus brunescens]|uniref:EAL domain-containing protein n=1 Tax=Blastococcus brunescens TaxID=1564165 RepID=A0ABZ1B4H6_9ACTN|nr:hypothetical protein [Blastococcus sp. BMG 8361]WRL63955.1 hypothetical protein U6N30_30895 [Blastococcus sp. BMG 8361]
METDAEAVLLRALGVDYGQGWHFGRPGPPEALAPIAAPVGRIPSPRSEPTPRVLA